MAEGGKTVYTPRERVVAAYKGEFADRVPAYPIAGCFAGSCAGVPAGAAATLAQAATRGLMSGPWRWQDADCSVGKMAWSLLAPQ